MKTCSRLLTSLRHSTFGFRHSASQPALSIVEGLRSLRSLLLAPFSLLLLSSFLPAIASAQDWAQQRLGTNSPRHQEWVTVSHDDRKVESYVTYPEVSEKATVVVVIHEIFGLSDWARSVTDELAEAGYIAIAPDLLSGAGPDGGGTASLGNDATRAIQGLSQEQINADLDAIVEYARNLPASNGKVVVAGFCWGGGQTFNYATHNPEIEAGFSFYGPQPSDSAAIARIGAPIYGFYAANDARVNATIEQTRALMEAAGKTYEPVIYNEGSGHGFMRAGEDPAGSAANKEARDTAWQRWMDLMKDI